MQMVVSAAAIQTVVRRPGGAATTRVIGGEPHGWRRQQPLAQRTCTQL